MSCRTWAHPATRRLLRRSQIYPAHYRALPDRALVLAPNMLARNMGKCDALLVAMQHKLRQSVIVATGPAFFCRFSGRQAHAGATGEPRYGRRPENTARRAR